MKLVASARKSASISSLDESTMDESSCFHLRMKVRSQIQQREPWSFLHSGRLSETTFLTPLGTPPMADRLALQLPARARRCEQAEKGPARGGKTGARA